MIHQSSGQVKPIKDTSILDSRQQEDQKKSVIGIDLKSLLGFDSKGSTTNLIESTPHRSSSNQRGFQPSSLVPFDISVLNDKSPSEQIVGQPGSNFLEEMSDYDFLYNTVPPAAALPHPTQHRQTLPVPYIPTHHHVRAPMPVPTANRFKYNYVNHFMNTNMYPPLHAPKYPKSGMNEISVIPWVAYPSWSKSAAKEGRNVPLRYEETDALNDFLLGMVRGPFSRNGAISNSPQDSNSRIMRRHEKLTMKRREEAGSGKDVPASNGWGQRNDSKQVEVGLAVREGERRERRQVF